MMEQQCLSNSAQQAFYEKVQTSQLRKKTAVVVKIAVIAACICLLIPITVFAVEIISGYSIVEIFEGKTNSNHFDTGYQVTYPDALSRPLSDFPEELHNMEEQYTVHTYASWEDAEISLGIKLINNTVLSGEGIQKARSYNLAYDGISGRQHCFAYFNGKSGQFYRAMITAAYRYQNAHITVHSTVTAQHPEISGEDAYRLHQTGVEYRDADVVSITQEPYAANNGIQTSIVRVEWANGHSPEYAACFFANGASYKITVSSYDPQKDAESRALLIDILDAFVF